MRDLGLLRSVWIRYEGSEFGLSTLNSSPQFHARRQGSRRVHPGLWVFGIYAVGIFPSFDIVLRLRNVPQCRPNVYG